MKRLLLILISFVILWCNLQAQNIECIGNKIEIANYGNITGTVQWQFSTNERDWINLPNENPEKLVFIITETGYFRGKVIYGNCEYFSDTTYIEAYPLPAAANAGADQSFNTADTIVTLSANAPIAGTGKWTIVTGYGGNFAFDTSPTSTFTGRQCTDYVLQWTISTACNISMDDVNIGFLAEPTKAIAGVDQSLNTADTIITLSANHPIVGKGKWTIVSGDGGNFANDTSSTSTFTGRQCTDYVLQWTISTACNISMDDVNIGFHAEPTIANAGDDINSTDSILTLAANSAIIGKGQWSIIEGIGGSFENDTLPTTKFIGKQSSDYLLRWTISTYCKKSFDDVYKLFNEVYDVDSNKYVTVKIGTQVWMAENLKTTKYRDKTDIPLGVWAVSTPGYCWYNNDEVTYKSTYGALYNWYAVNTGKLCPTGWHVPTDAEWTVLTDFLGGENVAGGKLKEAGTSHWFEPNAEATNETGFTALPGSHVGGDYISLYGYWWSSSGLGSTNASFYRDMRFNDSFVHRSYVEKEYGFSVRCLKD